MAEAQDPGTSKCAPNSAGSKPTPHPTPCDPNSSASSSSANGAKIVTAKVSSPKSKGQTLSSEPSRHLPPTYSWSTGWKVICGVNLDPWIWASLQKSAGGITSEVANCDDCAHCVDLYTPSTKDSAKLTKIRNNQYLQVKKWIEDYWKANPKRSLGNLVQEEA